MKTPEDADWAGVLRLPVRGPEGVVVVGVFDKANAALRTEFYAQQAKKNGPAGATCYSRQARTGAGAGFCLGMDFLPNASGWPRVLDAIRASGHADGQIFVVQSGRGSGSKSAPVFFRQFGCQCGSKPKPSKKKFDIGANGLAGGLKSQSLRQSQSSRWFVATIFEAGFAP